MPVCTTFAPVAPTRSLWMRRPIGLRSKTAIPYQSFNYRLIIRHHTDPYQNGTAWRPCGGAAPCSADIINLPTSAMDPQSL